MKKKEMVSINDNQVLKKNVSFRVRTLSNINYLYGENQCYELNEVAFYVWNCVNGYNSFGTILELISKSFNKEKNDIYIDVQNFIEFMISKNIFIKVNG